MPGPNTGGPRWPGTSDLLNGIRTGGWHGGTWHPGPGVGPGQPQQGPGSSSGGSSGDQWGSQQQSAFAELSLLLEQYGLQTLEPFLKNLILGGTTDSASIMLALQGTQEWKTRFAGNEMLKAQGLGVLSPAEYLATERSYAQIMKNYGLPQGFYDDPADFAKWIGHSVSAAELQTRVAAYSDLATREDPAIVEQLKSMGLTQGDLLAYTMDPERAAPLVMRQYQTALLGGAARRSGVVADNTYLGQLAGRGITEQQASQGYGLIGQSLSDAQKLSSIYHENYGLSDMQAEVFDNNAAAGKKRKKLASQERAAFSGQSGQSGIQQNSSGSY